MRLTFLGGADEIGSSSTLVQIGGRRIVVDFGLRHRPREGSVLPLKAPIDEGPIDAIVLTHAHLDHSGGLPVLHQAFPDVPVFMTGATLRLITLLLEDSLKIMAIEAREAGRPALFDRPAYESLLANIVPVSFRDPVQIAEGVALELVPAGHILGAATAVFRSGDGSVAISGDYLGTDQLTVPGLAKVPLDVDVVVTESTYGGRHHQDRRQEETRLLTQIGAVLEQGGKVLFPAFAVGRSQEILLLLIRAIQAEQLPEVPVTYDGLVRSVCQVYGREPDLVTPWLRHRIRAQGNPFIANKGPVEPLWQPKERQAIATTRGPRIIVSSSGMLTGGPSALYARYLAVDPKSFIAITGYQDEESPGRAVQNLARDGGGTLQLPDGPVELRCKVGTYGLSAHADTAQLLELVARSRAANVVLVHGGARARADLRRDLEPLGCQIHEPRLGESLSFTVPARPAPPPVVQTPDLTLERDELVTLATRLHAETPNETHSLQELATSLGLRGRQLLPEGLRAVREALLAQGSPFRSKGPTRFSIAVMPDGQLRLRGMPRAKLPRLADPEQVKQRFTLAAEDEGALHRIKFRPGQRRAFLRFYFPKVVGARYHEQAEWLSEQTGWRVLVDADYAHHERLSREAMEALPPHWPLARRPGLHLDQERVVVHIALRALEHWAIQEATERFESKTGFTLEIRAGFRPPRVPITVDDLAPPAPAPPPARPAAPKAPTKTAPPPAPIPDGDFGIEPTALPPKRAKQPQAIGRVRNALKAQRVKVFRFLPEPKRARLRLEVGVANILAPHHELLQTLSNELGWTLWWPGEVDEGQLEQLLRMTASRARMPLADVVLEPESEEAHVWPHAEPEPENARRFEQRVLEQTGWSVVLHPTPPTEGAPS